MMIIGATDLTEFTGVKNKWEFLVYQNNLCRKKRNILNTCYLNCYIYIILSYCRISE